MTRDLNDVLRETGEVPDPFDPRFSDDGPTDPRDVEAEKTISPMKDTLREALVDLHERYARQTRFAGEESGYERLDYALDGWEREMVYLLGGRPGMGKSIVGLNLGLQFASRGLGVDHITIEMTKKKQALRALFCWGRVQSFRMRQKSMRPCDWQALNEAITEMRSFPWYWDDRGSTTIDDIRRQVQIVKRKFEAKGQKLFCVIVDHILNIQGTRANAGKDRRQQVLYITNQLKAIAKDEQVCMIPLTQMKRMGGLRKNKQPTLEDLKESGSSEEDADVVILLHREDYFEKDRKKWDNILDLNCAKVRDGEPRIVKFKTDFACYRIDLLETEDFGEDSHA